MNPLLLTGLLGCGEPLLPDSSLGNPPSPSATPEISDPHETARHLLGDGLFLESGMGDYSASIAQYRKALNLPGLDPARRAELLYRIAQAEEKQGSPQAAAAYRAVVEQHPDQPLWSDPAQARLAKLTEVMETIRVLPVSFDFEEGARGWRHSAHYAGKGDIQHARGPERARSGNGALLWQTTVAAREDDLIYLALEPGAISPREVKLAVKVEAFPARLFLFAVEADGARYSSPAISVAPDDGWVGLVFSMPGDFRTIGGQGGGGALDTSRIKFLMLQDATGFFSTDRGQNRILLDDFALR